MENCEYKPVNTIKNGENNEENGEISHSRRSFLRQLFICSGVMCTHFVSGLYLGAPTVTIPQLRKEANSTAVVSDEMASWLSAVFGYGSLPWNIILPIISEFYGRKKPFIFTNIIMIISSIVFLLSTTVTQILISNIITGIDVGCCFVISNVIASEYTSPQYRGVFLTLKSTLFFWGLWLANATGTFFHWKNIGKIALVSNIYGLLSFYWPESPYWLAANGRFDECAISHRWLKGTGIEAENELNKLITSQKDYLRTCQESKISWSRKLNIFKFLSYKPYYIPTLLAVVIQLTYHFSGKLTCSIYAIEIIKKITDSEDAAYKGMLILDGVSVFCMYFGCYLAKIFNRRTLMISGTSIGIILLFIMSLYLYLIKTSYIIENNVISVILLIIFSAGVSCGPMILSNSIYVELLPLQHKNIIIVLVISISNAVMSTIFKLAPVLFKTVGIHGAFLFFGITETMLLLILYQYLPETKDKTLQEIEEYFKK